MKKKIISAIATLALGAALVGGGTFAYFNDTETVNNVLSAGTLDLQVIRLAETPSCPVNFDLRNLKPGDVAQRVFVLDAAGTLAIKNVWFDMDADNFYTPVADSQLGGYLSQFKVSLFKVVPPTDPNNIPDDYPTQSIIASNLTLEDLYNVKHGSGDLAGKVAAAYLSADNKKINLAPSGLSVDPQDKDGVLMEITFVDSGNQNIYQGDVAKLYWNLEATQYAGTKVGPCAENGYIKQNEQLPANGSTYDTITKLNYSTLINMAGNMWNPVSDNDDIPSDK